MHFYFITFTRFNFYILVQVSFALQVNGLTGMSLGPRDLECNAVLSVFIEVPGYSILRNLHSGAGFSRSPVSRLQLAPGSCNLRE